MSCFIISEEVIPASSRWTLQIHWCCFKIPCHHGLGLISLGWGIFSLGAQPSLLHHLNPCLVPNRGKSPYIMTQTCFTFWGVDDFERWKQGHCACCIQTQIPQSSKWNFFYQTWMMINESTHDHHLKLLRPNCTKLARYWWRSYGHGPT